MSNDKLDEPYVTIQWTPQDLIDNYDFDDEKAMEALDRISKWLERRSIELGWELIDDLLASEGFLDDNEGGE